MAIVLFPRINLWVSVVSVLIAWTLGWYRTPLPHPTESAPSHPNAFCPIIGPQLQLLFRNTNYSQKCSQQLIVGFISYEISTLNLKDFWDNLSTQGLLTFFVAGFFLLFLAVSFFKLIFLLLTEIVVANPGLYLWQDAKYIAKKNTSN